MLLDAPVPQTSPVMLLFAGMWDLWKIKDVELAYKYGKY